MENIKLPEIIQKGLYKQDLFTKALFERPESLSKFLPYSEYLEEHGIFVNKDGSLGAVFEIELIEHETKTAESIISIVNSIKSWFSLPENYVLQVIYEQMPLSSMDSRFDEFSGFYKYPHPVSKILFDRRLATLKSACNKEEILTPLERRGYLAIRHFPKQSLTANPLNFFQPEKSTLYSEMNKMIFCINDFKHTLESFISGSKIKLTRLTAEDLLSYLRKFFNPETIYKRAFAEFNPAIPISDQVIYSSPVLDYPGIEREGIKSRSLSLKTSPQYAYPGGMAYFTNLDFPFRIALNFNFPPKAKVKQFFDLKEFFLQNTPSARAKRQREEVLEVQDRLARDDRCLHLTFNIIIDGKDDEELDRRTRRLVNIFHHELECEAIVEKDIGLGLCLNSLPLNYSPRADLSAQRYIRILRSDATKFVPVFDSFKGLEKPLQLYVSRENNLTKFSLLENETCNHTVVLADSGSGKSCFVIDAVQAAKRMDPEPLVFVIDKKSSYLMLSEYFDAELTVFDGKGAMPFSPFRGVFDEDKIVFLTNLILTGVTLLSPTFAVDSDHYSVIAKALRLAYEHKTNENGLAFENGNLVKKDETKETVLTMEDVVAELGSLTSIEEYEKFAKPIDDLLPKLAPFYSGGPYTEYFNSTGSAQKKKSKLFFIYDLDALDADPRLQTLMTMAVVEEIRQTIKLHQDEGRQGFVILEELQMLATGNTVGKKFVTDAAQTFRKLGVWLISLTPRPQNYFENEVGQAMWGVADNFVFLQMSEDNVDYLGKHSSMLDAAGTEIIKSLKTIRGKYADVFYMNKKKTLQGAFRFFQTPLDRWLAPTNAVDAREARKALKQFSGNKWKALEYLAENFPEGAQ